MERVDAWFMRHFPPYSWRRLFFLLAFAPVSSTLVVALGFNPSGGGFSWGAVFLLTLCVWAALPLMWVHIRATADVDIDDAPARPRRPKPPPVLAAPSRRSNDNDFLYSFLISFAGFTIATATIDGGGVSFTTIAIGTGCALAFCLALRFRYSIWTIVAIAAVGGVAGAILLELFFLFLSDSGNFWLYWALSSLTIFVFLLEPWLRLRRHRNHPVLGTIPMWMISAAASTMLVIAALSLAPSEGAEERPLSDDVVVSNSAPPAGAATDQDAALRLFHAWRNDDRKHALTVADPVVVEEVFARPFDATTQSLGCNGSVDGVQGCMLRTVDELLILRTQVNAQGRAYIYAVERASSSQPITFTSAP